MNHQLNPFIFVVNVTDHSPILSTINKSISKISKNLFNVFDRDKSKFRIENFCKDWEKNLLP